jgi:hypothetical protein
MVVGSVYVLININIITFPVEIRGVFALLGVERGFLQLFFLLVSKLPGFSKITLAKLSGRVLSEIYKKFKIFFVFCLISLGLCVNLQVTFTSTNLLCTT